MSGGLAIRIERERIEAMQEVHRLRRALLEAVDELTDMVGYVPDYFRVKWGYDETIDPLRLTAERPQGGQQ